MSVPTVGGPATKICVYGAGAVGGHLAGRLGTGPARVAVIARGEQLAAIRRHGLQVQTRSGTLTSHPVVTDDPADLGPQDVVIVTVKAPALPTIAQPITTLLHRDTLVVFVLNGIPWWYFHAHGGPLDDTRLTRLDPDGALWNEIGPQRAVGAVAYTASTVIEPGVIRAQNARNRLIIGRPDGAPDDRLEVLAQLMTEAGVEASSTPRIRDAVWTKLVSNLIGGSLGVLTVAAMKDVLNQPSICSAAEAMAGEAADIAQALGCVADSPADTVGKLAQSHHLQSIAQDLHAGRPMEIDAIFRVPLELARMTGVATPTLDLIIELAIQRARTIGHHTTDGR